MSKRMFQILDEMNISDGENNTSNVGVMSSFVSINKVKAGCHITMGAPESIMYDVVKGNKVLILLAINKDEYDRLQAIENKKEE